MCSYDYVLLEAPDSILNMKSGAVVREENQRF